METAAHIPQPRGHIMRSTCCCLPGMRSAGLAVLLTCCSALPSHTVRAAGEPGKAVELFNGKDMTYFYTYLVKNKYDDPDKVFSIVEEDGTPAIRVSGQESGG